jgi:hypothetical protein
MPEMKDATDLFERMKAVLFYMTTDRFITETQACSLLWPLLEGSKALDTLSKVHRVHGSTAVAERCSEGVRAGQGMLAQDEEQAALPHPAEPGWFPHNISRRMRVESRRGAGPAIIDLTQNRHPAFPGLPPTRVPSGRKKIEEAWR